MIGPIGAGAEEMVRRQLSCSAHIGRSVCGKHLANCRLTQELPKGTGTNWCQAELQLCGAKLSLYDGELFLGANWF